MGEVITIPCLLPDAISMVSWKHRRVTNDKPTVIQELEGDQDLVIPFAKLGDAGTYHCETTLHDGRIQKSMQVKVFVEVILMRVTSRVFPFFHGLYSSVFEGTE